MHAHYPVYCELLNDALHISAPMDELSVDFLVGCYCCSDVTQMFCETTCMYHIS